MVGSKGSDIGHPVGYLATDGVVIFETCFRRNMFLDVGYDLSEFVQLFGRL